jgi:hypothetical protein
MGYFGEFYENVSRGSKPPFIMIYKYYSQARRFYGIVWIVYGNFMEKLCLILGYMGHH